MSNWTFWEWVAYAIMFVAAILIAADQGIKLAPELLQRLNGLIASPYWAFAPLALILLATGIFVSREFKLIGPAARPFEASAPQKPELHLVIPSANVFVPVAEPELTGIGVEARVWNTGVPSIATEWTMKIIPNGKVPATAQLTVMPNVLEATGEFNSAKLLASNSLESKTKITPIGITPVSGVLLFYVALPKNVVQSPDTSWEIGVKDIYERETAVAKLVGDWLSK
jgi:hypothetical protein